MGRRKLKIVPNITMTGIADKGRAVGRDSEGQVYFVEGAVPGDTISVAYKRKKKGIPFGRVHEIETPSEHRIEPFCQHFHICGGCKWQNLEYDAQLKYKEYFVYNAIKRLGKMEADDMQPIMGSELTKYYRNKMEFSFSNKRWITEEEVASGEEITERDALGFFKAGTFDKVVDIHECYLQNDPSDEIRNYIREITEGKYDYYDPKTHQGWLRNYVIRTNVKGDVMIIFSFNYELKEDREYILDAMLEKFPQIISMYYVFNTKVNSVTINLPYHYYYGEKDITEQLGDIEFLIGPKSFFQTNPTQAKRLYDLAKEYAQFTGEENVYDLYTGLGSIALYVADQVKHITGIEDIEEAIDYAKINQKHNNIENATFYTGDVKDILTTEFIQKHGKPDVIITDPPRAGMHKDVVEVLKHSGAKRIVYVSCNPATQARDMDLLRDKYKLTKMRPVDMFPHTHHVENVSLLELI